MSLIKVKTKIFKILVFLSIILFNSFSTFAQKSNYSFSANAGFYIGYSDCTSVVPGVELKIARAIKSTAQLTLGVSYISLRTVDKKINNEYVTTQLVPVMIGYRQNIKRFYIEPRVGLGELGGRISIGGDYSKPSVLAFFYSLGAGYQFANVNIGLEAGNGAFGIDSPKAGFWNDRKLFYSGIKIGLTLFKYKE
jgi:hypothetical protein